MAYMINHALCKGCDICSGICPTGAISFNVDTKKASIDPEFCVSCGLCSGFCENRAVTKSDGSAPPYRSWESWTMPFVDVSRCTGCSLCVNECPMYALSLTEPEYRGDTHTHAHLKDVSLCIGCEKCSKRCPINAISMIPQLDPRGNDNEANKWPAYLEKPEVKKHLLSFIR